MIRSCVVAAAAMILCACKEAPPPEQYSPDSFAVQVHWQESRLDLQAVARSFGQPDPVDGFSVMTSRPGYYRCDLYLVRLSDLSPSAQELLGHEFAHCLFGEWHR